LAGKGGPVTFNQRVVGSIPTALTNNFLISLVYFKAIAPLRPGSPAQLSHHDARCDLA
jgi:hypothetical protein